MLTKVKTTMIEGRVSGAGVSGGPITIVAAGQSNMVGWTGANNGPLFEMPGVEIWDRVLGQYVTADLGATTYGVYSGNPAASVQTVGGGRNNLAVAFAQRLHKETGRKVRVLFNATGGRHSQYWIGNGVNSVDWVALNQDIAAAGVDLVDYFLWQQGENDADDGDPVGAYTAKLGVLREQIANESWGEWAHIVVGKPSETWGATVERDYLASEIDAFGAIGHPNVSIAPSRSPWFGNPYLGVPGDEIHFDGRGLFSLGYYSYFEALPASTKKKTLAELFNDLPWPSDLYTAGDPLVAYSAASLNNPPSQYNLEPSITKIGSRFFVGYTANKTRAGEGEGTFARIVWSDDEFSTIHGLTGNGAGFIENNTAAPKLWAAPDGSLWCFMVSSAVEAQVFDGLSGVWVSVCVNPLAANPRWSKPRKLVNFGWTHDPVFVNGAWHLPVSYWRLPAGGGYRSFVPALAGRHMFKIDHTNFRIDHSFIIAGETDDSTYDEHTVYALISGRLRASWRTLNGPVFSDAIDYHGDSWSQPAAFTQLGSPRPAAKHTTVVSPTGRFLAAWCDAPNRSNLTLGASDLGAQSSVATYKIVLQAGGSAYPAIYADGTDIYVAYDNADRTTVTGGGTGGKIRVAKVNEAALAAGTATVTTFTIDPGA